MRGGISGRRQQERDRKMPPIRALVLPLLALASVLLTVLYVVDILRTNKLSSGCEMTYSWPMYTPIVDGFKTPHRKYSLHSVHMQTVREQRTGVPVLFVPGHMGSYKQARSIGRHLWDIDPLRYDVFAVDFQEELTGLHGHFVDDQAQFLNDAIRVILKQYKKQSKGKKKAPESVVIVAHSMGGVVARAAELLPNYKRRSIQHVVSLGTPYEKPPFPFDSDAQDVYARIAAATTSVLPSTVYISISGGHKDTTIHASLSRTDSVVPTSHGLALLSTKLPSVGVTVDHLCLVWCHQLLHRVASSIDAVVDHETRTLIKDEEKRMELARAHLLGATEDDVDVLTEIHRQALADGYHSADEFATYGALLPQALVRLIRVRGMAVLWIIYLVVVHIFYLQLTHWQRRFDLQAEPATAGTSPSVLRQENFPSFTSLLHPAAHAPGFVKSLFALIDMQLSNSSKRTKIIGGLATAFVVLVGVITELARRFENVRRVTTEVVELSVLYMVAVGLLYTVAIVFSALRAAVQPLVRIALAIARRTRTTRWVVIMGVFLLVQFLGHIQDFELLPLDSAPRHLALLVLGSFVVFVLHIIEIGVKLENLTADQQRYRATIFTLLLVSDVSWVGKFVFFVDVVRFPPHLLTNELLFDAVSFIATLALYRYFITLTDVEMVPLPPTAFFDMADGDDGNDDSDVAITAENCPRCVFEDGGPGAIFIEYENRLKTHKMRTRHNEVVVVGPTFRVVSCDCVLRFKQRREYCEFCTRSCRLCGGGSGNYAQAQKYRDFLEQSKTEVAFHSLVAFSLELTMLVLIALQKEHYISYATPFIFVVLSLYHGLLRHPTEVKKLKTELRKRQKKATDTAARKKQKKRASAARRRTSQKTPPPTQAPLPPSPKKKVNYNGSIWED
jgi:GPI inositol-deacylase